jgi:hypothetical protein
MTCIPAVQSTTRKGMATDSISSGSQRVPRDNRSYLTVQWYLRNAVGDRSERGGEKLVHELDCWEHQTTLSPERPWQQVKRQEANGTFVRAYGRTGKGVAMGPVDDIRFLPPSHIRAQATKSLRKKGNVARLESLVLASGPQVLDRSVPIPSRPVCDLTRSIHVVRRGHLCLELYTTVITIRNLSLGRPLERFSPCTSPLPRELGTIRFGSNLLKERKGLNCPSEDIWRFPSFDYQAIESSVQSFISKLI